MGQVSTTSATQKVGVAWLPLFFTAIIFGLNTPNHQKPIPSFFIELITGIAILGAAVVSGQPKKPPTTIKKWHWFLILPLLAMVQHRIGILNLSGDALIFISYGVYAWILAIATASMNEAERVSFVSRLLHALLTAWLIGFFLQLLQWWGMKSLWLADTGRSRPSGNLTQPNHFATWTVLAACSSFWLNTRTQWPRIVLPTLIASMAFSLALSASRTGYLAVAACTFWAWWRALAAKPRAGQPITLPLMHARYFTALLVLTIIAVALRPWIEILLLGRSTTPPLVRSYDSERLRLLAFAAQATLEKPWTGWGIYQTPLAQTNSDDGGNLIAQLYPSTHNLIADLFVWLGIPLGLLVCVLIGFFVIRSLRSCTHQPDRIPLQGMLLTLVLHGMLEYPLYYLMWLGIFVVLLVSLTEESTPSHGTSEPVTLRWTMARALTLSAVLAGAAYLTISYLALQDRLSAYYLDGRCTAASPLSAVIWQRYELTLDILCDRPLPDDINPLNLSTLAGSREALHKIYSAAQPGTQERESILRAGCRLGVFSYYCRAHNRDTRDAVQNMLIEGH